MNITCNGRIKLIPHVTYLRPENNVAKKNIEKKHKRIC